MLCVGIPIGSAGFITAALQEVVADIRVKADLIVQTGKATVNASQALMTSACLGLASMFNHLLRSLPPSAIAMQAREVDAISFDCVRSLLRLTHVDLDSEVGGEMRQRLFLPTGEEGGGVGVMSCVRVADAAYIGHWALVGPTVSKMLPHLSLADPETMALQPLAELKLAAKRVADVAKASGIKRVVSDLPVLLANSQRGLQGEIGEHLNDIARQRFLVSMPRETEAQKARVRAFVSGSSKEAGAALYVSRLHHPNRLTDNEHRVNFALRLGVDAFPPPLKAVKCPDCQQTIGDLTAHALSCSSSEARANRTKLHTAMEVASRLLLRELDPQLIVNGANDAYPVDYGFAAMKTEFINHHADASVFDSETSTTHLIDFTFCNAQRSSGLNGAKPGAHGDMADDLKEKQYVAQFEGFSSKSSTALVVLSMERHGSWSKGTRGYWAARLDKADSHQKTLEFPTHLSVLTRRVRQTLAIALWRVNACHILQFYRRAIHGTQRRCAQDGESHVVDPEGGI